MRPFLIFLDEPTSGLDSFAAFSVIKKLAQLSSGYGTNVLVAIHQPSSEVFHTFQQAMLLTKGRCLFMGGIDALSRQLAANGHPCKAEYNLCDHAVFIIQTESDEHLDKLRAAMDEGMEAAGDSFRKLSVKVAEGTTSTAVPSTGVEVKGGSASASGERTAGFWRQLYELSKRENEGVWRNKPGLIASIVIPIVLNLFFAGIFAGVGDTSSPTYDLQSHFGAITQVLIGGMFGAAQPLLLRFPLDRGIFLREYATSCYGATPYFLSRTMVEIPRALLEAVLVHAVVYWIMALQGSWIVYVMTYWITGTAASSTALLVGCIASNPEVASQAAPLIFVPQLLFAGFFIKTGLIPDFLAWIQYICGLKYGMNIIIINEFGAATRAGWAPEQQAAAERVITTNEIDPGKSWLYVMILVLIICCFRFAAIAALTRRSKNFF